MTPIRCHSNCRWSWWRHQMETFSASLAICAGNSPVPGEFPTQRPVTRSFDVFFDLRLNKRLSKQSWGWWFETLSRPLWRHRNGSLTGAVLTHWQDWPYFNNRSKHILNIMTLIVVSSHQWEIRYSHDDTFLLNRYSDYTWVMTI